MGQRDQSQRHLIRHDPGITISDILHAVAAFVSTTISARISDDTAAVSRVDLEPVITYHTRAASMVSLCVSTERNSYIAYSRVGFENGTSLTSIHCFTCQMKTSPVVLAMALFYLST